MRKPRLQYSGALYHVIVRGNHRLKTFLSASDYKKYLELLSKCYTQSGLVLYAYCLMPNHVHLLVEQGGHQGLSRPMQRLQTTYTSYFNRRYKKWGHLFQGRYKAILVDKDSYLLELIRYIHLNPYRAKLEEKVGLYPWSSHSQYMGREKEPLVGVAVQKVMPMFSRKTRERVGLYGKFINEGKGHGHRDDIYDAGGWQILVAEDFKSETLAKAGKRDIGFSMKLKNGLKGLWNKITEREGLESEPEGWKKSRLMAETAYIAMEHGIIKGRELAEFFGVDASAISQARGRLEIRWEKEAGSKERLLEWAKGL